VIQSARLPAMSLAVVGARHANADGSNRAAEIAVCEPGEVVLLVPEPDNEFDARAVAVLSNRGVQIGYISAERCGRIGALIRSGRDYQVVFQRPAEFGAWIRIAFDGDVPAINLAPAGSCGETPSPGEDFYPDEDWPDD